MGDALAAAGGGALILLAFVDALATTLVVGEGAGPVTRALTGAGWRVLLRLHRSGRGSRPLGTAGGLLLFATVLIWVAMLWAGWALVFWSGDVVVDATTGAPAGWVDVAYFSGFTVFTLGVGDYVASTGPWRLVTAMASFSGLFLVTLAITYLLSVVAAVVARRALAVQVHSLGTDATEVVLVAWDGARFDDGYAQQLVALSTQVAASAEQHLAYPILHAFHSTARPTAAPLALAELHDALLLLTLGVDPPSRPAHSATVPLRRAIERYLDAAGATAVGSRPPLRPDPPPLDLGPLRRAGVPVVADEVFAARLADASERRRHMARMVATSGWSWPPAPR